MLGEVRFSSMSASLMEGLASRSSASKAERMLPLLQPNMDEWWSLFFVAVQRLQTPRPSPHSRPRSAIWREGLTPVSGKNVWRVQLVRCRCPKGLQPKTACVLPVLAPRCTLRSIPYDNSLSLSFLDG